MNNLYIFGAMLDMATGLVVLGCAYLGWEAMSRRTKHCFRFAYGLIGVAALGIVVLPLYPDQAAAMVWFYRACGVGFACYLVLDRRRIDRVQQGDR